MWVKLSQSKSWNFAELKKYRSGVSKSIFSDLWGESISGRENEANAQREAEINRDEKEEKGIKRLDNIVWAPGYSIPKFLIYESW